MFKKYKQRNPEESFLYQIFYHHFANFYKKIVAAGRHLPKFVIKEVWDFLNCGILKEGFSILECSDCKKRKFLPFSCKKRGFCPSCNARKMNESSANLIDRVLPKVAYRQYVLSIPPVFRPFIARNKDLLTATFNIYNQAIKEHLIRKANLPDETKKAVCGFTVIQRAGSALNLNYHFHGCYAEGLYYQENSEIKYYQVSEPTYGELRKIVLDIHNEVIDLFTKKEILKLEPEGLYSFKESKFSSFANIQNSSTKNVSFPQPFLTEK